MTLFETLLYIALLGILMTSLILSTFSFLQNTSTLQAQAILLEEELLLHFNDFKK